MGPALAEPTGRTAAKLFPQAAASGKGHGSGHGAKANPLLVPALPHTALATPGGTMTPLTSTKWGLSPVGTKPQSPGCTAGVKYSSKSQPEIPSKEQPSPAGRVRQCQPMPRILFTLPALALAPSAPCCLSFPGTQELAGMLGTLGMGWATMGGAQPRTLGASCNTQHKPVWLGKRPCGVGPGGRQGMELCMGTGPGQAAAVATCREPPQWHGPLLCTPQPAGRKQRQEGTAWPP